MMYSNNKVISQWKGTAKAAPFACLVVHVGPCPNVNLACASHLVFPSLTSTKHFSQLLNLTAPFIMEDKVAKILTNNDTTDYWASPTTQVFAFIGLLWLSLKIFSFWRMIASLFVLPGISVSLLTIVWKEWSDMTLSDTKVKAYQ